MHTCTHAAWACSVNNTTTIHTHIYMYTAYYILYGIQYIKKSSPLPRSTLPARSNSLAKCYPAYARASLLVSAVYVSLCRVREVIMHNILPRRRRAPRPCFSRQSEKVGPQQQWLRAARPRTRSRKGLTRGRPLVKTVSSFGQQPVHIAMLARRREGAPRVSHLREQRAGDRGSDELLQIELCRGAGAASWRCGRSAPSGRTQRRARLDKLSRTWRGCRPSAPVLRPRLAVLTGLTRAGGANQ